MSEEDVDPRITWMKNLVVPATGILDFEWTRVMKKEVNHQILYDFINTDPHGTTIYFYAVLPSTAAIGQDGYYIFDPLDLRFYVSKNEIPAGTHEYRSYYMTKEMDGDMVDEATMAANIDMGVMTGDHLRNVAEIINQIYIPLIEDGHQKNKNSDNTTLIQEFRTVIHTLASSLINASMHVNGQVYLKMPDVTNEELESGDDFDMLAKLEAALDDWTQQIALIVEQEKGKVPKEPGPNGEIEFWRQRNAIISTVYEQANLPKVQQILSVLQRSGSGGLSTFNFHRDELKKLYTEAVDNVKFLSTLERYFKNIMTGDLKLIKETLEPLMNGLRMIWIISRHYNTDERMVPLMERIAEEIADKVALTIDIKNIFRKPSSETIELVQLAIDVLEGWSGTYQSIRKKIEDSGTDHRWEFEKRRLFERTNYMAEICKNIQEVSKVLDEFKKFLGPDLREVTGDTAGIDNLCQRVESLIQPMETSPFDIFDKKFKASWENVMTTFRDQVRTLEEMTVTFINSSFRKLRSALGAFELLKGFQNIKSRQAINETMNKKFDDILVQFLKEIDDAQNLFHSRQSNPPLNKNYPPVAGAIIWATSLYSSLHEAVISFKSKPGLMESPRGLQVREKYLALSKEIDAYALNKYQEWVNQVKVVASEHLKQPLLTTVNALKGKLPTKKTVHISGEFVMPPPPYAVNFSNELRTLVKECKYLDEIQLEIPETALNVSLQAQKFHSYCEAIEQMLSDYHNVINNLNPVEKNLLHGKLDELNSVLKRGFDPLNWNSLHIHTFIDLCNSAIMKFQSTIGNIHKFSNLIEDVITAITKTSLVQEKDFIPTKVYDLTEFCDILEKNRQKRVQVLKSQYENIGDQLIKIEEEIENTNTGKSPLMYDYYIYWEKKIFNAITTMILKSFSTLGSLLQVLPNCTIKRGPLFEIVASINPPDIVITPTIQDVDKMLRKVVDQIVGSARSFVRWKDRSCLKCEELKGPDDEPIIFSFYDDISGHSHVVNMIYSIWQGSFKVLFNMVKKYIDSWRKYDKPYKLWDTKKNQKDQFRDQKPGLIYFDSRLSAYQKLAQTVSKLPGFRDVVFVRVDCQQVAMAIQKQADALRLEYGGIMRDLIFDVLQKNECICHDLKSDLDTVCNDLEDLKFVLNKVNEVTKENLGMSLVRDEIEEWYRTLELYNIPVDDAEKERELAFRKLWKDTLDYGNTMNHRLSPIIEKFRKVTVEDVNKFLAEIDVYHQEYFEHGPTNEEITLDEGVELLDKFKLQTQKLNEKREELVNTEMLFKLPITPYPKLIEVQQDMNKINEIYAMYKRIRDFIDENSSMLWSQLDIDQIQRGADQLEKEYRKFSKELKGYPLYTKVKEVIDNFKESLPLIQNLKDDCMKQRHWQKLMEVTGVQFTITKTFTLQNIFAMNLARFKDQIDEIVAGAQGEAKIENMIKKIEEKWKNLQFGLSKYMKGNEDRGFVLKSADDIKMILEEDMLNLQSMSGSRFATIFIDDVKTWEKKLNTVSECIEIWFKVQAKWMYLESIFIGSEDIRLQLPEESKRFDAIDKNWKNIMIGTNKNPNCVDACHCDNRVETLNALSKKLDDCQKGLSDYLATKRNAFPRFFFLSDDELLSVLGSSDPQSIQVHLLKLFANCKTIHFGRGCETVTGMTSSEGESYNFEDPSTVEGPVENWMTNVQEEMKHSLRIICKTGVFYYAKHERIPWIEERLGMVTVLGSQIWWTWEVEDVFRRVRQGDKRAMKTLERKLTGQLNAMVAKVRENLVENTRKKFNTLLIIDVHARDIVDSFVRDSILDEREFAWESQLRFYWDHDSDDVRIRQCTGTFKYGYEYMGLNDRLVITPLTDRCYMTITQALTFNLGCSPAGPAGTGKTETVKDLSKGLALPCFVTNCGEGLDYKAMGSIFSGLCQVGAWGCFDEFNRINIEVLSVVSAQIRAIQNALNEGADVVDIGLGKEVKLDSRVGIFITMNPGYAGRTELPDNLKALFRPVTMIKPDLLQICEIMLFSEGFESARVLAKKMTVLYQLAQEQLSKQYHYDFGLRALKSVLVMAGSLKRQFSDKSEELVLMRALRDMNMPKFVFEDVPLFQGLIGDLFPGLDCPRVGYPELKQAIEEVLTEKQFHHSDEEKFQLQVDKVIQLYETMLTRHTTMIVGPTGGGKTVVIDTLQKAMMPAFDKNVKIFVLNPKAQGLFQLYGVMDPVTRDWTNGVLSNIFRSINKPLPIGKDGKEINEIRWILYDGDVDAVWVEDMNSVMDDNRTLTLPNGERIRLQNYCKMLFETFDLQYASPATISRCGMVFVDPKNLEYQPYYEWWVKNRCDQNPTKKQEKELLMEFYMKYVPPIIAYILEGLDEGEIGLRCRQGIPFTNLNMVMQLTSFLDAILIEGVDTSDRDIVEGCYLYSIYWSFGACLDERDRTRFDLFVKKVCGLALPNDQLFYQFFDVESRRWEPWDKQVTEYQPPVPFEFYKVLVPTRDFVVYSSHLKRMSSVERPSLFVGISGTAKTITIRKFLEDLEHDKFNKLTMNFSSRTTGLDVQKNIEENTDKRMGKIYGPPNGKRLMTFIDDLNMPRVDKYGTQQPIALLLFLIGRHSMFERSRDLELLTYRDMNYVAAMGPPGGGRNAVDPRFVSLFSFFDLPAPSEEVLNKIYSTIAKSYFAEFTEGIQKFMDKITPVTLHLYTQIIDGLPPTPSKFHYIFNLRDLGRIYEGMCLATPDIFKEDKQMARLWINECKRIFSDRLICDEDIKFLDEKIRDGMKADFSAFIDEAIAEPMVFGNYKNAAARICEGAEDARLYQDLGTSDAARAIFDEILENYNVDNKPMNLVLFLDALNHLTRIIRIICVPRGNALLVGVGGSGKQSLTRLGTYTLGYTLFEISLSKNYGENEFRDDLKELYKLLGKGPVVFLFTDAHCVEESFLELLNNMLTTGMVPALYESDEKDGLLMTVRPEVQAKGIIDTPDNLWNYYVDKCRNNLHIVLAMSPSGDALRIRCRNFPGMVSNTVIDWFFPWPQDALEKVGEHFLAEQKLPEEHRMNIIRHMVYVHISVVSKADQFLHELRRHYYVTPKNYLEYLSNYINTMKRINDAISSQITRLDGGLGKLSDAAQAVEIMSKDLAKRKVVVDQKKNEATIMINDINTKKETASRDQEAATMKQKELEEDAVIIEEEQAKANTALEAALPALEAASEALKSLNKKDIVEIRSFANPPNLVKLVCTCVVYLKPFDDIDDSGDLWGQAKMMMTRTDFLDRLQTYEKDKIKEKQIQKVKRTYSANSDFNYNSLKTVSKAGAGLFKWVDAMVNYYDVFKSVQPLKEKVAEMEKRQEESRRDLANIKEKLLKLQDEIETLSKNYAVAKEELDALEAEANLMEKRLNAASKLISGLGGEQIRWTEDKGKLLERSSHVIGDALLCASFLSYAGAFTFNYREDLIKNMWLSDVEDKKIPLSEPFNLQNLLSSDAEVQRWIGQGLPADEYSVQNGILTSQASRFPLCIDPQQQAVAWIKNKEKANHLIVRTFADDFMKHLESAVQFGHTFVFENVDEEIDPIIDPILEKNTFLQGTTLSIKIGDKVLQWDTNFRLFLTSKLANPHYSPEVMGKLMIINYSVTLEGLENQLLNVVVYNERPDLEEQYVQLIQETTANTQMLVTLEDTLLRDLANSEGNILDNEALVTTLDEAKTKANDIKAKLEQAKYTTESINKTRAIYSVAAKRGSILFFAMSGLSIVNSMYEISLASFLTVFKYSLKVAKKDPNVSGRLRNIMNETTSQCYDYTCTGIFERHKLMFSFQMVCMILEGEGMLNRTELDFFLKGDQSLEDVSRPKPFDWLTIVGWKDLVKLATLKEELSKLPDDVMNNEKVWKDWYDLETPEKEPLPMNYNENCDDFELLLIYRCFRPDRVYNAVKLFVIKKMGSKFVQPPVLDYNRVFSQSTAFNPVVFILSPGADPQSDIQLLGAEKGFKGNKFRFLALGQGQGEVAEAMLESGISKGYWVLLQNCHLLTSWLKVLEKKLESMHTPHEQFRLWLTTDPTDKFPLGILQRSVKVVTEPPDGLKQNMRSLLSKLDDNVMNECPHTAYRPLIFTLCFLHAVVLERRKYGKIGWNVSYDFNESDFNVSRRLLGLYLTKAFENGDEMIPWGSLKYLIGDAMYGGRVSDNFDRRVLQTYLNEYFGDFLFDTFQHFYFSQSDFDYTLPEDGPLLNYTEYVETFPLTNSPAVFGLHPNAEISYFSNAIKSMWRDLIDLQPRTASSGTGISREDYIGQTAAGITAKLPELVDLVALRKRLPEITPTLVVLLQEIERWNNLVAKMTSSLTDLQKALKGEIGMSDSLDALGDALYNGFLPEMWARLAPATLKPLGSWMNHFKRREAQYNDWMDNGDPKVIWLSGLHIPESYLTALIQTTCRIKNWPLDKSTLYTVVSKYTSVDQVPAKLEHGTYVTGLYLEGAKWDLENMCLAKQDPKVLVVELPILQVIPIEASKLKLQDTFQTPVYVTQNRRNAMGVGLVFNADLSTKTHISHWVLQGVALFLNTDE